MTTAGDIVKLLKDKYRDGRQYVCATEVGLTTGFSSRQLDFIAMNCYRSNGFCIEGIEIKVSKSDLRRELEHPDKHAVFYEHLDYFSIACPKSIIDMKIIPEKWGVYVVDDDGSLRTRRKPLALHDSMNRPIDKAFAACFMRRVAYGSPASSLLEKMRQEAMEEGAKRERENLKYRYERLNEIEEELERYKKLFGVTSYVWSGRVDEVGKLLEDIHLMDTDSFLAYMKRVQEAIEGMRSVVELCKKGKGGR